jgi:hypothetical protein
MIWARTSIGIVDPLLCLAGYLLMATMAHASNLQTCLDGRYPSLCDKNQLSQEQRRQVESAEHRANLTSCMDGRYPALCGHGELSATEQTSVRRAEHAANLRSCLDGRYPALCRHAELDPGEASMVSQAEHRANLSTCLDGRYPPLCRHQDLGPSEAQRVAAAERLVARSVRPPRSVSAQPLRSVRGHAGGGCESGHWIESVMDDGSVIKLEDGSLWKVNDVDTVDSSLWLPTTEIVACDGKLINTDDNETVEAEKIRD